MESIAYLPILTTSVIAFLALAHLLREKRISDSNTLFFACVIVLLYLISVIAFLPAQTGDKIMMGLISIASAIIGFLSRGVEGKEEKKSLKEKLAELDKLQKDGTINLTDYDALKKKLLEKFVSN